MVPSRRKTKRKRSAKSNGTGTLGYSDFFRNILKVYDSLEGLANQPLEKLLEIKGLSDVKIIRIAAAFELARRLTKKKNDVR